MSWLSDTWSKLTTEIKVLSTLFDADVWPYIKSAVLFFMTAEGKIMLQAAVVAAPTIVTGGFGVAAAAVGVAAVAAAPAIAAQDATVTLAQAQTALQLVKNTQGITSSSDAPAVQAIQTAQTQAQNPSNDNAGAGQSTSDPASQSGQASAS